LSAEQLAQLATTLDGFKPIIPGIKYQVALLEAEEVKGYMGLKSPYYALFYSERKAGYLENVGFIGQLFSLYLTTQGIGSCWLGMSKTGKNKQGLPYVIAMSYGKTTEKLTREPSEFRRLPLEEVSNADNEIIRGVALAPSAKNLQGWYFYCENDLVHCYRRKLGTVMQRMIGGMVNIDLGIAISHLCLLCQDYEFIMVDQPPIIDKCEYFLTVKSASLLLTT